METSKRALSPRSGMEWMNDASIPLVEHIERVANFDYSVMDPSVVSRHKAHEANIQQKEIRRHSVLSNRSAVIAHRALIDTIEV